ncbi:hypothetical protein ACLI4Z_00795 [Natrialbaceae archaeon A-arb3/5]
MKRRRVLRGIAGVTGAVSVAGCTDSIDMLEETSEQLQGEANETVEDATSDLERPPDADLDIAGDGTITVISLNSNTVGVKCGPIEGDDPVQEVQTHDDAASGAGETIEDCSAGTVVAVSENGTVEVIEQL